MGIDQLRAEFAKKYQNNELKIVSSAPMGRPAHLQLQRTPLRLVQPVKKAEPSGTDLIALTNAAGVWSIRSTNQDLERAGDYARDKLRAVRLFFAWLDKDLLQATPMDITAWFEWLRADQRLSARTVYNYASKLSSFFEWLLALPELRGHLHFNPVRAAFPRCPEPYQSAGTKSLSDGALRDLWRVMERAARSDTAVGLRDYAIFRFFAATGDRRREILSLQGSDIELLKRGLIYFARKKGGRRLGKTINDLEVVKALRNYLKRSGRTERDVIGRDVPLWLAHDHAQAKRAGGDGLSSHAFARRMQIYAERAGIYNFHLHQLRHTFARIVSEDTQSLSSTQEALGHKNLKTTRIYVESIEIKADHHSSRLKDRIRRRS